MKCKTAQLNILLQQSGELISRESDELAKHLGECSTCRALADESAAFQKSVASALPSGEPGAEVLAAIRKAAAEGASRSKAVRFRPAARRVLAWAAVLLLVFGISGAYLRKVSDARGEDARLADMDTLVCLMGAEEDLETAEDAALTREEREAELAARLLEWQGLGDAEFMSEDDQLLLAEPLPEDLQSHSVPERSSEKCV